MELPRNPTGGHHPATPFQHKSETPPPPYSPPVANGGHSTQRVQQPLIIHNTFNYNFLNSAPLLQERSPTKSQAISSKQSSKQWEAASANQSGSSRVSRADLLREHGETTGIESRLPRLPPPWYPLESSTGALLLPSPSNPSSPQHSPVPSPSKHNRTLSDRGGIYDATSPVRSTSTKHLSHSLSNLSNLYFLALLALWYSSSTITSNTTKAVLRKFPHPVAVTLTQFVLTAVLTVVTAHGILGWTRILGWWPSLPFCFGFGGIPTSSLSELPSPASAHPSAKQARSWGRSSFLSATERWHIFRTALPLSVFQVLGHVMNSTALGYVPVATVHTVKALSPLFTVLALRLFFLIPYPPRVYLSLLPITLGVMLVCTAPATMHTIGLAAAFGSTMVFVIQNIWSKKLFNAAAAVEGRSVRANGDHSIKLDKWNLLFHSATLAALLTLPILVTSELPNISSIPTDLSFYFLVFVNSATHFAQSALAFILLGAVSPVTYSVASLGKRIVVVVGSMLWAGEATGWQQVLGVVVTFGGLWMYQEAKSDVHRLETRLDHQHNDDGSPSARALESGEGASDAGVRRADAELAWMEGKSSPLLDAEESRASESHGFFTSTTSTATHRKEAV
ncbi:TPT-domain-containing protein [Gonapodya prolifera JEL478]|uniref:TPT-domain-containing protein n=1 Tax=Gonapodya prolifera (strain JEL478) TaxID=1344416 RepID=A0A139AUR3_GONPJ|nr:TPT-domain-containing protein [Gonapodya prolifera JEL478]|eukprot:KXS20480.1 TPT-domain-containing protein [Gonapodya prolifera JEL478]